MLFLRALRRTVSQIMDNLIFLQCSCVLAGYSGMLHDLHFFPQTPEKSCDIVECEDAQNDVQEMLDSI